MLKIFYLWFSNVVCMDLLWFGFWVCDGSFRVLNSEICSKVRSSERTSVFLLRLRSSLSSRKGFWYHEYVAMFLWGSLWLAFLVGRPLPGNMDFSIFPLGVWLALLRASALLCPSVRRWWLRRGWSVSSFLGRAVGIFSFFLFPVFLVLSPPLNFCSSLLLGRWFGYR